jgi:hypothetical protein
MESGKTPWEGLSDCEHSARLERALEAVTSWRHNRRRANPAAVVEQRGESSAGAGRQAN